MSVLDCQRRKNQPMKDGVALDVMPPRTTPRHIQLYTSYILNNYLTLCTQNLDNAKHLHCNKTMPKAEVQMQCNLKGCMHNHG